MIAVITSSGAFLYDLTVEQADKEAQTSGYYSFSKQMIGWLFHSEDIPYKLMSMGISTCYIDLKSIDEKQKDKKFCKVSTYYLMQVWEKVFPIHDFFKAESYSPIETVGRENEVKGNFKRK